MPPLAPGTEWLVDAHDCDPALLRSVEALGIVFSRAVDELQLHPIGSPVWQVFPAPGGVTGMQLLSESHLACHTFPENGFAAFNLYCCREREEWPWPERLAEILSARTVAVRRLRRGAR